MRGGRKKESEGRGSEAMPRVFTATSAHSGAGQPTCALVAVERCDAKWQVQQ